MRELRDSGRPLAPVGQEVHQASVDEAREATSELIELARDYLRE